MTDRNSEEIEALNNGAALQELAFKLCGIAELLRNQSEQTLLSAKALFGIGAILTEMSEQLGAYDDLPVSSGLPEIPPRRRI